MRSIQVTFCSAIVAISVISLKNVHQVKRIGFAWHTSRCHRQEHFKCEAICGSVKKEDGSSWLSFDMVIILTIITWNGK